MRPCLRRGRYQSRYFAFNKRPHFKKGRYHRFKYLMSEDHKKQTKVEALVLLLNFGVEKERNGMSCIVSLVANKKFINGL